MPADIKLDQEITLHADEVIYESENGDRYLVIDKVVEGARIEGVSSGTGKSTGTISLSFAQGGVGPYPAGSFIGLTNDDMSPSYSVKLDGSRSSIKLAKGGELLVVDTNKIFIDEGKVTIFSVEKGDSICKLQLNQNATPSVSAQSSFEGGSVVIYDGDGQPSIVLDGRTGTIYARGEIQQGVDQALLDSLAAALVW